VGWRGRTDERRRADQERGEFLGIGLSHAARDDKSANPSRFLCLDNLEDRVDGLDLGVVDESTGIDHDDISLAGVRGHLDST